MARKQANWKPDKLTQMLETKVTRKFLLVNGTKGSRLEGILGTGHKTERLSLETKHPMAPFLQRLPKNWSCRIPFCWFNRPGIETLLPLQEDLAATQAGNRPWHHPHDANFTGMQNRRAAGSRKLPPRSKRKDWGELEEKRTGEEKVVNYRIL